MTAVRTLSRWLGIAAIAWSAVAAGAEGDISVSLHDVKYGLFAVRQANSTGSQLTKRYTTHGTIKEVTDRIPAKRGSLFGAHMRIDADQGDRLQLAVVMTHPPLQRNFEHYFGGTRQSSPDHTVWTQVVRNHREFSTWYALEYPWEMVPGAWTMKLVLIGVDDTIAKTTPELQNIDGLVLYERSFDLYAPDAAYTVETADE